MTDAKTLTTIAIVIMIGALLLCGGQYALAEVLQVDYTGFTVWLDCDRRGAVRFRYLAQRDGGNVPRQPWFTLDPHIPARCQQSSTASYRFPGARYDRGHLAPANHLDASLLAIQQSNHMVNIVPQAANMNRGAWRRTEDITECYRDIEELLVIGGVLWGHNSVDDHFVRSHGIATPDALWKLIIRESGVIAWIIPNNAEATAVRLDDYLVSVDTLEHQTGEHFPDVPECLREGMPSVSWIVPVGCDKS